MKYTFIRWFSILCLLAQVGYSQDAMNDVDWISRPMGEHYPDFLDSTHMTYDTVSNKVVIFSASRINTDNIFTFDTWEWDGSQFEKKETDQTPPLRTSSSIAYHPILDKTILFGGLTGNNGIHWNDTWSWNGNIWQEVPTSDAPAGRYGHRIIYNGINETIVLFGGRIWSTLSQNDMWEFDGMNWKEITPATIPPKRDLAGMTYVDHLNKIFMFGGRYDWPWKDLGDSWTWDGSNWEELILDESPTARDTSIAYDKRRKKVTLFGGLYYDNSTTAEYLDDTWEWDENGWQKIDVSNQPPAGNYPMLYVDHLGKTVLFDMENELIWEYGDIAAPVITILGEEELILECGIDTYIEAGANAVDSVDGNLDVSINDEFLDITNLGVYYITYTAQDFANNISEVTRTIIVQDTTPPSIECPQDISIQTSNPTGAVVEFMNPIVSDGCDSNPQIQMSHDSGMLFSPGTTQVTIIATDSSGNTSTCSFNIVVSIEEIATPTPTDTPTIVTPDTPTPSPTPTVTNTPTPTDTPVPQPTPTTADGLLQPPQLIQSFEFDQNSFSENGWGEIPGGFLGSPNGFVTTAQIDNDQIPTSTDNRGISLSVRPGEVAFIYSIEPIDTEGNPIVIRMMVRSDETGATLTLGALKGNVSNGENLDGSIATLAPATTASFMDQSKRMVLLYEPDTGSTITPVVQLASSNETQEVKVVIDQIEIYQLDRSFYGTSIE
jgi:hypothetical protein